jgi:RNA methyltransferase, TrmH family
VTDHPRKGSMPPPSPWKTKAKVPARERDNDMRADAADTTRQSYPRPSGEIRLYGRNACLAAYAKRPQDLRKVYLTEARLDAFRPVLAWCAKNRLGYRIVESGDLDRLTGSRHHEGVCFEMLRPPALELAALLGSQPAAPQASLLIWLDGVGNPHNLGALLRSAAHFGAAGVIVPTTSSLDLSGAAARVAEGGAEAVPLVRVEDEAAAIASLRRAGYALAATVPREGVALYATKLPSRIVLVFGAEGEGVGQSLLAATDLRISIPGSGAVDSLNIAASAATLLGEYWRQNR